MSGIELRAAGVAVSIHERSDRVLDDRGAGIVMQPGPLGILTGRCGLKENQTGVWLRFLLRSKADKRRFGKDADHRDECSGGLLFPQDRSMVPHSPAMQAREEHGAMVVPTGNSGSDMGFRSLKLGWFAISGRKQLIFKQL